MKDNAQGIQSFNVISAATVVISIGVVLAIFSIKDGQGGLGVFDIPAGVCIGAGLAALYLGAQWNERRPVNNYLAIAITVVTSIALSTVFAVI